MNIFAIEGQLNSIDWEKSAQSLDNLRIVKMVLETTQLLCTGLNENGVQADYKSFNPKHPSCKWVSESACNWQDLLSYAYFLKKEYFNRFNKKHKCTQIIEHCAWLYDEYFINGRNRFPSYAETPLKMAMPDQFKNTNDIVGSYRKYYVTKPNIIYPENCIPSWFIKLRDPKLPFKIKTNKGKIEVVNI